MQSNSSLPIYSKKIEIQNTVKSNKVTIVCGDTGCGKTTQVPQYVLEMDPKANIVCTQPRRLAAINIAKRVAQELGESVGYSVGYHVGMANRFNKETKILFVTTGIFLQRLVNDPNFLDTVTYVILDEVHERDVDIDFTMVILKHLLATSKFKFKLILMSATINTELFSHYFAEEAINQTLSETAYVN